MKGYRDRPERQEPERRQDASAAGQLIAPRGLRNAARATGDTCFAVKISYWMGVR